MTTTNSLQKPGDPVAYYNALHPLAEVSGREERTGRFIAAALEKLGIACRCGVGGHGVVAEIDSGKPGPGVMFRADMDALPYANADGSMTAVHACGHDAHCSMLLAAAPVLKDVVKRGKLKLVFQPGEEDLTGALAMIRDGVLEGVDIAIGAHIRPASDIPAGYMTPEVMHVACATIRVRFQGATAHASRPQQGVNPIDMAASYISMVNAIRLDPNASWSTKATRITGEPGATNSLSAWCEVVFDLRAQTNPLLTAMLERMQAMAQSTALAFGGKLEWTQIDYCPASDYDPELVEMIRQSIVEELGEDKLASASGGGGEDFHFYKIEKPSVRTAYFGVGVGAAPGLHKRDMTLKTQYLANGVRLWITLADKLLGQEKAQ